jgi:hypothetical protein
MQEVESLEGELPGDLEAKLTAVISASAEKVSNYCLMMDHYDSQINFIDSKIKEANEYKAYLAKQIERMEVVALKVIKSRGERLTGTEGRWISTRKSSSVKIIDPQAIPPDYVRIKIEPDKTAIKKAIDQGELVPGADIEVSERISYK